MSAHAPLLAELDRWHATGRAADLWLRDDDAADVTPALQRFLDCVESAGVPMALAVIPMAASGALAARVAASSGLRVWQHGISHTNHVAAPAKKQELVDASDDTVAALNRGLRRLQCLFGAQVSPVLVPPWNRMEPALIPRLPEARLHGLSSFKPRREPNPAAGVWQVNTHIDIIDWKGGRGLHQVSHIYQHIADHLAARRTGKSDPAEPTGILTHHLVMEESALAFLSDLFALTNNHPAARWCVPDSA